MRPAWKNVKRLACIKSARTMLNRVWLKRENEMVLWNRWIYFRHLSVKFFVFQNFKYSQSFN